MAHLYALYAEYQMVGVLNIWYGSNSPICSLFVYGRRRRSSTITSAPILILTGAWMEDVAVAGGSLAEELLWYYVVTATQTLWMRLVMRN